jgi:hypothetical protein
MAGHEFAGILATMQGVVEAAGIEPGGQSSTARDGERQCPNTFETETAQPERV